jgi:hypothetical protein
MHAGMTRMVFEERSLRDEWILVERPLDVVRWISEEFREWSIFICLCYVAHHGERDVIGATCVVDIGLAAELTHGAETRNTRLAILTTQVLEDSLALRVGEVYVDVG